MGRSDKIRFGGSGNVCGGIRHEPCGGTAAVTGAGNVAVAGATFSTVLTNVNTTKPFVKCEGTVYDASKTTGPRRGPQREIAFGGRRTQGGFELYDHRADDGGGDDPGGCIGARDVGRVAPGEYWVRTKCKEGDDVNYQDPLAPIKLTITNTGPGGTAGSSSDLLGGIFGSS